MAGIIKILYNTEDLADKRNLLHQFVMHIEQISVGLKNGGDMFLALFVFQTFFS